MPTDLLFSDGTTAVLKAADGSVRKEEADGAMIEMVSDPRVDQRRKTLHSARCQTPLLHARRRRLAQ